MAGHWRPDQAAVLGYTGGPLAVAAVPGAGKTHVLAGLTARLIAEGRTGDGAVLVVTYMRSAVANFRRRVAQFLTEAGLPPDQGYEVRTIHSLAARVVQERPDLAGLPAEGGVLGEEERRLLLSRLAWRWREANPAAFAGAVATPAGPDRERHLEKWAEAFPFLAGRLIEEFKQRLLTPEAAARLAARAPVGSFLPWVAEIYREYERTLAAAGQVDFTDLLVGARRVLDRDPGVAARLRQRWPYLCEDEAQDSSPIQQHLLQAIAGPGGNLVRVGDPNQAIMGSFTAADPAGFQAYLADPGVRRLTLEYAGRSGPCIREVANRFARWVALAYPDPELRGALLPLQIRPVADGSQANPEAERGSVMVRLFASLKEELEQVAAAAAMAVERYPDRTVAVLLPNNWLVGGLAEILERLGAPWRGLDPAQAAGRKVEELLPGRLVAALQFLAAPERYPWPGPGAAQPLLRVLWQTFGLELPAWLRGLLAGRPPEEWLYPPGGPGAIPARLAGAVAAAAGEHAPANGHAEAADALLTDMAAALIRVRGWLDASDRPLPELIHVLAADLDLAGEELAVAGFLAEQARQAALRLPDAARSDLLAELLGPGPQKDRQSFLRLLRETGEQLIEPGAVYVGTYHKAKGLEWDVVYLAGLNADQFPAFPSDPTRGDLDFLAGEPRDPLARSLGELQALLGGLTAEDAARAARREYVAERLRLVYVGITRARRQLRLSGNRGGSGGPALALQQVEHFRRECEALDSESAPSAG